MSIAASSGGGSMSVHYFRVRKVGERLETEGSPSCFLGHELPPTKANKPEGTFVEWSWDGSRLRVRNDRYGFCPLYYFAREGEIALSNSIPKLIELGAPTELDDAALAVFLRLGFFLGEDTAFRAIRAVPPDTSFEWKEGALQVSGKLALGKAAHWTRSNAVDAFMATARAAIRRRLPATDDFVVPLSGGMDSRHILLELCEAGHRPKLCVTVRHFPPRNNSDAECAAELTKALNVKHVILNQPESRFQIELKKNLKTGFCTDEHTHFMVLADYLKGQAHTAYDGTGGDVYSHWGPWVRAPVLKLFDSGQYGEIAERYLGHDDFPARMLPREQRRTFSRELAISRLVPELERHGNVPNPISSFFFWNRTRREISLVPCCILDDVPVVFCPFLDHEFLDFQASLSPYLVKDDQFHSETINKAFPAVAQIPYESKTPPVSDPAFFLRYARELGRFLLGRYPSRFVRGSYLLPRLLRCLLDQNYGQAMSWLGPLTLYLLQLEAFTAQPRQALTQPSTDEK